MIRRFDGATVARIETKAKAIAQHVAAHGLESGAEYARQALIDELLRGTPALSPPPDGACEVNVRWLQCLTCHRRWAVWGAAPAPAPLIGACPWCSGEGGR